MNAEAIRRSGACAAWRARLGAATRGTGWKRLGLVAGLFYLLKGLLWLALGYAAFGG
jgi:hypothetical protein